MRNQQNEKGCIIEVDFLFKTLNEYEGTEIEIEWKNGLRESRKKEIVR